jgi:flagellar biogenesis protein FliO
MSRPDAPDDAGPIDVPPLEILPDLGDGLLRTMGLLAILLFGAVVALWLVRRYANRRFGGRGHGLIQVIEVRRLEAGRALYVVEVDDQRLLLGVGEAGWSKLARLGGPMASFDAHRGEPEPPTDDDHTAE